MLTFQWDSVCADSEYNINATDCGACPNTTISTSVICIVSGILTSTSNNYTVCTLSVDATVCGFQTSSGNESDTVTAILLECSWVSVSMFLNCSNNYSTRSSNNNQFITILQFQFKKITQA